MNLVFHTHKFVLGRLANPVAYHPLQTCRYHSKQALRFSAHVSEPSCKYQLYLSNSNDPFLNLSIEHYLLRSTPPTSTVLFLYINHPCIVIGRNQNPWLEVNLSLLADASNSLTSFETRSLPSKRIEIVRRRSGGGTVFHDYGNVNFSVICPPEAFTRDKHAEMVVRAIRHINSRARVNERHDIVLDTGSLLPQNHRPSEDDMHRSAYEQNMPLKVSGSAYKLTRTRALHHGTCLINSVNVGNISSLLRSPLGPYVMARGVESVKSAVGNVAPEGGESAIQDFKMNVIKEFCCMYGIARATGQKLQESGDQPILDTFSGGAYGVLDEGVGQIGSIKSGMEEMKSVDWLYGQTPRFTFSTFPTPEDPRPRPTLPANTPSAKLQFTARGSRILSGELSLQPSNVPAQELLIGQELHRLGSWNKVLQVYRGQEVSGEQEGANKVLGDWLDEAFGSKFVAESTRIMKAQIKT